MGDGKGAGSYGMTITHLSIHVAVSLSSADDPPFIHPVTPDRQVCIYVTWLLLGAEGYPAPTEQPTSS